MDRAGFWFEFKLILNSRSKPSLILMRYDLILSTLNANHKSSYLFVHATCYTTKQERKRGWLGMRLWVGCPIPNMWGGSRVSRPKCGALREKEFSSSTISFCSISSSTLEHLWDLKKASDQPSREKVCKKANTPRILMDLWSNNEFCMDTCRGRAFAWLEAPHQIHWSSAVVNYDLH